MTKRFVIATDPLSADEEKALKKAIDAAGWWHWLPNFWLVKDSSEQLSAAGIRDAIYDINDTKRCLVLEVDEITWAAVTKEDTRGRNGTEWIQENWKKRP